jgi:bifunctional non-homologous end joining protein LigD
VAEFRADVELTNLDKPLFDGAEATKRDLVDYLDAVHERILPGLRDRPLSVIRVRPGQPPFMQKNVPKYTPDWVRTTAVWAAASKREVHYALCDDRRTLLWFANQRAVEYHPTLMRLENPHPTHLVLDLDPPEGAGADAGFPHVIAVAKLVRRALDETGLAGAVKTSGAKGLHVFVPLAADAGFEDTAAATRALRTSPPRRSSATTAAARCSSTPPARVAPRWWRPTARGPGPACPCRSRCAGRSSTVWCRPTSPCTPPWPGSVTPTRGRS